MTWHCLIFIVLFLFFDVSVSDEPIHPTSSTETDEYYTAQTNGEYRNKTIICNYYNNASSPKNCHITCKHQESCFEAHINCNNAPNCDIECSPSQFGCASAKINTANSNNFHLHCATVPLWPLKSDSLSIPCHGIQVYHDGIYTPKPKAITSTAATIDCAGMAACYRGSFDVSNYDLSDISCHTDTYTPFFGTSCAHSRMYGNQNTKIICHGGKACTLTNITLSEYGDRYLRIGNDTNDNYNIECLGAAMNDTWTCSQMVVDAINISHFGLNCAANKGCANTQIIVSPLKKNENKIRCIPGSYPLIGGPRSCEWMTIWTDIRYELGFLDLVCEGEYECAGLEMWCFDSNTDEIRFEYIDYWTMNDQHLYDIYGNNYDLIYYEQYDNQYYNDNYLNYSMNNYNKKNYRNTEWPQYATQCQPLSDGVLFTEWPLLQIINIPSNTYNDTHDHTEHAVFHGNDRYKMQYRQINCTKTLQYDSCDIICDSYFSCQGAYIAVHDKLNGNVTCKNRGCFFAAISIRNITETAITRCENYWSCFFTEFDLYNIDTSNAVDINCGNDASDNNEQLAMCALTMINAREMNNDLNINCNNGTFNCFGLIGYGPYQYDTNINCNIADRPCIDMNISSHHGKNMNIDCSLSPNGCQDSVFKIDGVRTGNFVMNCSSNSACLDVEVILNGVFNGKYSMQSINCYDSFSCEGLMVSENNTKSNMFINCHGTQSCILLNVYSLNYPELTTINDDTLSINCIGDESCSSFELLSKTKSFINITCNGNSACDHNEISIENVKELDILCNGTRSCEWIHIQHEHILNDDEVMILPSNISIICNGMRSCYQSVLNTNNLNISCNDTSSCQLAIINVTNPLYLQMKCGDLSSINNKVCSQSNLYISGLSKHSNIECGDCSLMTVNIPYNYSQQNDFLSISCITNHKNCNLVNRTGFKMYCYNDSIYVSPNDERINCQNGYPWPLIFEPKPNINNNSGVYFIAKPNNPYYFEYSNISCAQYNKSCFIECNGDYSCSYSLIQHIGAYNLSVNCAASGGCMESNILFNADIINNNKVTKKQSNFNLKCDAISSCSYINVKYNGSTENNIISNSNILFSNKSLNMNFSIFNNENILFKVYNNNRHQSRSGLDGEFLLFHIFMWIENITKLDIESNLNLSISSHHIFGHNVEHLIINSTQYNSINDLYLNLIDTDMMEINCTNSYSCNGLNVNVSNDADIQILCGEYHETLINTSSSFIFDETVEMLYKSCINTKIMAPNANSMDIVFGAKDMNGNSIYGPPYYNDNGTIIVVSNIYCIDFGCFDLELISLNGLKDWNITLNGECQCNSINQCINEWNIECGVYLNYTNEWNGNNDQCTTSNNGEPICCPKQRMDELISSFNIYLDAVCPNNGNDKKKLNTTDLILIIAGGCILILLLIALLIFVCKRKKRNNDAVSVPYSQIEK